MNAEKANGLLLSLIDQRAAEHNTAELDIDVAIELCRIAVQHLSAP